MKGRRKLIERFQPELSSIYNKLLENEQNLLLESINAIWNRLPQRFFELENREEYETWRHLIEGGIKNVRLLQDNNPEKKSWGIKFSEASKKLEKLIEDKIKI